VMRAPGAQVGREAPIMNYRLRPSSSLFARRPQLLLRIFSPSDLLPRTDFFLPHRSASVLASQLTTPNQAHEKSPMRDDTGLWKSLSRTGDGVTSAKVGQAADSRASRSIVARRTVRKSDLGNIKT